MAVTITGDLASIITGAGTFLGILGNLWMTYRNTKQTQINATAIADTANRVEQVHKATNSLTDRLVATTKTEAHAAGVKEEYERAQGSDAPPPPAPGPVLPVSEEMQQREGITPLQSPVPSKPT